MSISSMVRLGVSQQGVPAAAPALAATALTRAAPSLAAAAYGPATDEIRPAAPPAAAAPAAEATPAVAPGEAAALPATAKRPSTAVDALSIIVAFIPTEAIGIYVALLGLIQPESYLGKWMIFGIGVASIFVIIALNQIAKSRAAGAAFDRLLFIILSIFALLAFTAWSAALPGTPFLELSTSATKIGAGGAIILAALLPKAASIVGIPVAAIS